jgi:hypothetical protein
MAATPLAASTPVSLVFTNTGYNQDAQGSFPNARITQAKYKQKAETSYVKHGCSFATLPSLDYRKLFYRNQQRIEDYYEGSPKKVRKCHYRKCENAEGG